MLSLKNVMVLNASSCLLFGLLFALMPGEVANFLGSTAPVPKILLMATGAILIFNGLHLIWASRIPLPKKELILYFSGGDFIWVILSAVLLISGTWITTSAGVTTTILISLMVGFFGVMQMIKRKEMGHC